MSLVPSHILVSNTDIELTAAIDHREARLKTELDKIAGNLDFVFIDCPPTLSWLTINALTASQGVIVVVSPGYFELDSIVQRAKPSMKSELISIRILSYWAPVYHVGSHLGYLRNQVLTDEA